MIPRWAGALLGSLARPGQAEDMLGDLEETHRGRVRRHGSFIGSVLTGLEALEMTVALIRERIRAGRAERSHGWGAAHQPAGLEATMFGRKRRGPSLSWLDVKLGLRILVKYPGLSLVGGLGMAVVIAIGAIFAAMAGIYYAALPLEEGDRVVSIENWDVEVNNQERQILHDFVAWRGELESVEDLGAYRTVERNLIIPGRSVRPVVVAQMTASGFQLARVQPLLGRFFTEEDERASAPPVVVIGHDVWQRRFARDPDIIGQVVELGNTARTVIGVMPAGFEFPVYHNVWVPFRANPSDYERREGPEVFVFGRLASAFTLEEAQAELTTIGQQMAATFPETHEGLRPRIVPYTVQFFDDGEGFLIPVAQFLVLLLLAEVCVNIAILVYARTATRQGEIAVRSALGASRRRIVGQLFVEALVLSAVAAMVGLLTAGLVLRQVEAIFAQMLSLPFWMDFGLSAATVVYVLGLTVIASAIVGVLPALKATGRRLRSRLGQSGGGTAMRFGRTWTVLVVAQVAVAAAILPMPFLFASDLVQAGFADPGFPADEYLTAELQMDRQTPPSTDAEAYHREFTSRYAELQAALARRLEAEPAVGDVTFAMNPPGEEPKVWIQIEGVPMPSYSPADGAVRSGRAGHTVGIGRVAVDFFDTFDVPILTGREFQSGDLNAVATAAIVNRSFAQHILGGGNALGRRIRYVGRGGDVSPDDVEMGRWYEIVGIVPDFPDPMDPGIATAKVYHPMAPGAVYPVSLSLRVRATAPATFTGRLREITAALDPGLRLDDILPLDEVLREEQTAIRLTALGFALVTMSILLLSSAGIYALMSFTVAQRQREIALRSALGAAPRRLLRSIFARALRQVALGIVVGGLIAPSLLMVLFDSMDGEKALVLLAVSAFIMAVGFLAAVGPARRGLRIEPMEVLREE